MERFSQAVMWGHNKSQPSMSQEENLHQGADTPISDIQIPELWENKFILFKTPNYPRWLWQPKLRQVLIRKLFLLMIMFTFELQDI